MQARSVGIFLALALILALNASWGAEALAQQKPPIYVIGYGDVLEISVWKDDVLSREVLVRPDGFISFPLIGEVRAEGRSIQGLRDEIAKRIEAYVPNAPVAVILSELNSAKVYVMGKVGKPGIYTMPGRTTILQVLAMAGGFEDFADTDDLVVLRNTPMGQEALSVSYDDVVDGEVAKNIYLQPGDTIVVK